MRRRRGSTADISLPDRLCPRRRELVPPLTTTTALAFFPRHKRRMYGKLMCIHVTGPSATWIAGPFASRLTDWSMLCSCWTYWWCSARQVLDARGRHCFFLSHWPSLQASIIFERYREREREKRKQHLAFSRALFFLLWGDWFSCHQETETRILLAAYLFCPV